MPLRGVRAGYGARLTFCWRGRQAPGQGHRCRCFPIAAHQHRARLPHGGSASIPRNWLVCAQPAAPDGTHVGRTESADPISYEIAETIRGDPCEVEQAVREHAGLCIDMRADEILISADGHAQTSESPNMATAAPSAHRGPRRRRGSTPGCPSWPHSHPWPASVFPVTAARKVSAPVRASSPSRHVCLGPRTGNQEGS